MAKLGKSDKQTLKIEGPWEKAVGSALEVQRPEGGFPEREVKGALLALVGLSLSAASGRQARPC